MNVKWAALKIYKSKFKFNNNSSWNSAENVKFNELKYFYMQLITKPITLKTHIPVMLLVVDGWGLFAWLPLEQQLSEFETQGMFYLTTLIILCVDGPLCSFVSFGSMSSRIKMLLMRAIYAVIIWSPIFYFVVWWYDKYPLWSFSICTYKGFFPGSLENRKILILFVFMKIILCSRE